MLKNNYNLKITTNLYTYSISWEKRQMHKNINVPKRSFFQRVLNDLERAKLSSVSCGHLIRLHAHPSPFPFRKLDQRHMGRLRKRYKLLPREGRGGWVWSRIIRPKDSLVLYNSLNTLCLYPNCIEAVGHIAGKIEQCSR